MLIVSKCTHPVILVLSSQNARAQLTLLRIRSTSTNIEQDVLVSLKAVGRRKKLGGGSSTAEGTSAARGSRDTPPRIFFYF